MTPTSDRSTLVFSLGPVQAFIAQSRRTADGWAGSYLLSYLIGRALQSIWQRIQSREIVLVEPHLDGVAMWEALTSGTKTLEAVVAALPNTILLDVPTEIANGLGEALEEAVSDAWSAPEGLTEELKREIQKAWAGSNCWQQWDRQVVRQWECNWAWGADSAEAYRNLAARKGLREFEPLEDRGERCTVCGCRSALWQPHGGIQDTAKATRACWKTTDQDGLGLRWADQLNQKSWAPATLVRTDGSERLCAVCLIKRLLPWCPTAMHLWPVNGDQNPAAFPSTSTIATINYRAELARACQESPALAEAIRKYIDALSRASGNRKSMLSATRVHQNNYQAWRGLDSPTPPWPAKLFELDGDVLLYGESVANEEELSADSHRDVSGAYRAMQDQAAKAKLKPPPIYWALVTMDGDEMGKFIGEVNQSGIATTEVSGVLAKFAAGVPAIVDKHNGRLVFAGGDDVVAMCPVVDAMAMAEELRVDFVGTFTTWLAEVGRRTDKSELVEALRSRTLSGAIVMAHHQAPLGRVIQAGHQLLKDWAKKRAGRNAIAIQRFHRSGPAETTAHKWHSEPSGPRPEYSGRIEQSIKRLANREVAARLFYNLRSFSWLLGTGSEIPRDHRLAFLASLARKSRLAIEGGEGAEANARDTAELLMGLCEGAVGDGELLPIDPLLLARFMAGEGREER